MDSSVFSDGPYPVFATTSQAAFPGGSAGKESACGVGDLGFVPGLGRSPGEGNGYPLQCSGLGISMDWTVHGVAQSRPRPSGFPFTSLDPGGLSSLTLCPFPAPLSSLFRCFQSLGCLILCGPVDCSTPGLPVLHHLPEFAQTHVHWVGDAIQPSHPLLSPFSCPQSFPASGSFPVNWLRWPKYWSFSFFSTDNI